MEYGVIFFFNDTATTEIYTLSLHDALPISRSKGRPGSWTASAASPCTCARVGTTATRVPCSRSPRDRKSTRLNSSHANISYAVFCLKQNKNIHPPTSLEIVVVHFLYLILFV